MLTQYRQPGTGAYYASASQLAKSNRTTYGQAKAQLSSADTNYEQFRSQDRLAVKGRARRHVERGTTVGWQQKK